MAIVRARRNCDTVLVVRVNKSGELACSKPCELCQESMKQAGVKEVYYSDMNGNIQQMRF